MICSQAAALLLISFPLLICSPCLSELLSCPTFFIWGSVSSLVRKVGWKIREECLWTLRNLIHLSFSGVWLRYDYSWYGFTTCILSLPTSKGTFLQTEQNLAAALLSFSSLPWLYVYRSINVNNRSSIVTASIKFQRNRRKDPVFCENQRKCPNCFNAVLDLKVLLLV